MNKELAELALKTACDVQGEILSGRRYTSETYRAKEGAHYSLRVQIDGLLGLLTRRMQLPISNTTPEASYQIGLAASFTRSHYIVSSLLLEGELIEAVTLLRKNLEVLARLNEVEQLPLDQITGKTPNAKYAFDDKKAPVYGHLSEIAHFSTPDAGDLLQPAVVGDRIGPRIVPAYDERAAGYMDLLQYLAIRFAQWQLTKLHVWYPGASFYAESQLFMFALELALRLGVVRPVDPKSEAPGKA